jgi:hypothetical protein
MSLPGLSETDPRFPGEDASRSLAEMAELDLDAALQLLADRAQYITGASGAAIALRCGEHNDMLCRASAGSNAPELGALLSMECGLSGECVRTRQPLRCDDAERDPRVNREVCRELAIASVVILPILSGEQVLGVFELLSGKPRAFDERDLSALLRLSEMVETAVKHAAAMQTTPTLLEPAAAEIRPEVEEITTLAPPPESAVAMSSTAPQPLAQEIPPRIKAEPLPAPKKPLFWSAAMRAPGNGQPKENAETIAVPLVLRTLQKCQACGFPVSKGRAFCVECEEKQWRGQRLSAQRGEPPKAEVAVPAPAIAVTAPPPNVATSPVEHSAITAQPSPPSSSDNPNIPADTHAPENSTLFLSSGAPSESWLAANKYILGALLVVAIVIAAIALLR